jgi:hypothetical protein
MLAVAFDTLKLARKLESAGMASKQAQDTSAALSETYTEWLSLGNVATREDVQKLEAAVREDMHEVRAEIAGVRSEMGKLEAKLDAKIDNVEARLEAKIEAKKTEILYWMVGQTIVLLGALFGLIHYPLH